MSKDNASLFKRNPRIDTKVVKDFERLGKEVPEGFAPKKGANYGLTHPMDTAILTRRSRYRNSD